MEAAGEITAPKGELRRAIGDVGGPGEPWSRDVITLEGERRREKLEEEAEGRKWKGTEEGGVGGRR